MTKFRERDELVKDTSRLYQIALKPKDVVAAKRLALVLSLEHKASVAWTDVVRAGLSYIKTHGQLPPGVTPEGRRVKFPALPVAGTDH